MHTYTIAISLHDEAFGSSSVVFFDVVADTSTEAWHEVEGRKDDRKWLKALLGHDADDHDDVIDGIRIEDWQVVPGPGV